MSDSETPADTEDRLTAVADTFGRDTDPLAEHVPRFEALAAEGIDPFDLFVERVIDASDPHPKTRKSWNRTFRYWREHMADEGRNPACPNEGHVRRFMAWRRDDCDDSPRTVKKRVRHLRRAYQWFQGKAHFPHPSDYDPFEDPWETESFGSTEPEKKPHPLTVDVLRERVRAATHIRDRAIILAQLKLGLRAGEVRNLQLQDLALGGEDAQPDLYRHYPTLGIHDRLEGRQNAVYIPARNERDGNKSVNPRVLPLDDELRGVLARWLLVRPDPGLQWVFLTMNNHMKIYDQKPLNRAWKGAFHPEYAETDRYRPVTSHFGRHWFTTYWRNEGLSPELLKYMRGDGSSEDVDTRDALNTYIHTYYDDVREPYLANVPKLMA